jgi:ubiquinone/menaquinone biosynthesis C-methylase UbiE
MRADAQSFDHLAADYHRMGELGPNSLIEAWLESQLPQAGRRALDLGCGTGRHAMLLARRFGHVDAIDLSGPMIELAQARRPLPNVSYQQADLHDLGNVGSYDFVFSSMTLHHVPDLHTALSHIKAVLAPGGRLALADVYVPSLRTLEWIARRTIDRTLPLRPRLHALAALHLAKNLACRRGAATSWEIYRLQAGRSWLDHRVSDRFFTRDELERCCRSLFPGYRIDTLGGERGVGLIWNSPES